jgi:hypothetical protein
MRAPLFLGWLVLSGLVLAAWSAWVLSTEAAECAARRRMMSKAYCPLWDEDAPQERLDEDALDRSTRVWSSETPREQDFLIRGLDEWSRQQREDA